jgi:hypothetical protein
MFEEITIVDVEDLFLAPICLLVLYGFAIRIRTKYKGTELEKYILPGLTARLVGTVLYTLIIGYYYKGGDTTMYYRALLDIQKAIGDNSEFLGDVYLKAKLNPNEALNSYFMYDGTGVTHYYMYQVSNYMVPKVALPLSMIFAKSYLCISFCLAFFAFGGCWRIFKLFYSFFPHLHKKIAIATLFLPSVLFWSSTLIKDSITMGALGFFVYAFYKLFFLKEKVLINVIIVTFSALLLFYIKPYIILCCLPAFLIWAYMLLYRNIKDWGLRMFATIVFASVTIVGSIFFMQKIASSELASQYATQNILKAIESQQNTYTVLQNSGSSFEAGQVDNSVGGLLKLFPLGIVNSLFRPFLWEVKSPIMLLTALEALIFMWLTFLCFKYTSFKRFGQILRENPYLVFCFVYSVLFAGLVGMSTLNFGTLARYKIPALPFYLILLFVILDKSGKVSPNIILHKKLF